MLRFDSWPPEEGKVHFTDEAFSYFGFMGGYAQSQCSAMGEFAANLLVSNTDIKTATIIAYELAEQARTVEPDGLTEEVYKMSASAFGAAAITAIQKAEQSARTVEA